jgi:hypothetical protein
MAETVKKKLGCGKSVTLGGALKMGDFRRWVKAEQEGDFETSYKYLSRIVQEWDWELDPAKVASYDELTMAEYRQLNEAVSAWLMAEAAAKN